MFDIPDYFKDSEFQKVGCSRSDCNPDALSALNRLRHVCGFPFVLTSAYRSPYNEQLHGRSTTGPHTTGHAFDVRCVSDNQRFIIVSLAPQFGFTRIGIGRNFVHLDNLASVPGSKKKPAIWHYY